MFKRLNNYLIENHPNVWHLRLPFLIFTGFIFHVFAFLYGYSYLNERVLAETNFYQFSLDSNFILVQVILMLIVFFLWGLQFYKNSVLKHYYTAGRFYGVKLFTLMAVLFFWNISSFVTFDYGIQLKRDQLAQKYNFGELIKEKKFLDPLFSISEEKYELSNNPELNTSNIEYKKLENTDESDIYLCTKENYLKHFKVKKFNEDCRTKVSEIDASLYSRVDNSTVIFYKIENLQLNKGCYVNVINKFLKLDGYHWNELRNHKDYSNELDQLLKEKSYEKLVQRMTDFKKKINTIYNFTNFNPQLSLNYILQKNGRNLKSVISDYYNKENYNSYTSAEVVNMDTSSYSTKEFRELAKQYYYFDQYRWETTSDNVSHRTNYYNTILITLIFSMVFAYFLLQFQIINFINFAIAVPIAGVLLVLGILFGILFYDSIREYTAIVYLFILLACLIITYKSFTRIKERANEVFILLFASIIPVIILVTYGVLSRSMFKQKELNDPCFSLHNTHSYFVSPPFYEWHFIILGLLSCFGFLLIVKRLKSKPE